MVAAADADTELVRQVTEALLAFDPGEQGVGVTERITGFAAGDGLSTP